MMELQIIAPKPEQKFPEIKWNYLELKAEVQEAMKDYQGMVVTSDSEKDFKDTRARLNKLYQAIESARKDMKSKVMAPFTKFESEVKEVEEPIISAIQNIDGQLKEIDSLRRIEKRAEIEKAFSEYTKANDWPDFLDFDRVYRIWNAGREPWLNKTCKIETIVSQIAETGENTKKNLQTLQALPEFSFEAVQFYKSTLNLDAAIQKAAEMAEIQKRKQEAEAKKAETDSLCPPGDQNGSQSGGEAPNRAENPEVDKSTGLAQKIVSRASQAASERTYTFLFEVTLTLEQATALGTFAKNNGIVLINKTPKKEA